MRLIIVSILIIVFASCGQKTEIENQTHFSRYIESELPFTDLFNYRIKDNSWIRNNSNILTVHETFKISFYKKYLTPENIDQKPFVVGGLYYNISLRTKIDSLLITYPDYDNASKYYQEFWKRRKSEKNDSIVNVVLTEVSQIIEGKDIPIRDSYVNHTFQKMIDICSDFESMNEEKALDHFNFLKANNMHQSAYNLLYESFFYDDLPLNRDSLENGLLKEEYSSDSLSNRSIFIIDNSK